jgi:hypothetical protein
MIIKIKRVVTLCIRNLAHQGQIIHELTLTSPPAKHSIVCQVFAYTARYVQSKKVTSLYIKNYDDSIFGNINIDFFNNAFRLRHYDLL